MNLSEVGMFIMTNRMSFPFDSDFDIQLHTGNEILHIPVKVTRIDKSGDHYDCIGVTIPAPSQSYLQFVKSLRSSF